MYHTRKAGNNTVFVQLSRDGSYWNENTAGIFKTKYSKNKKKVESVPAVGTSTNAYADGVNHGQTEGATVTSGNSPATSEIKGSEISGENNPPAKNPTVAAIQEAVMAETGNTVEDNENAYMAENALSSKNKAEQDIYMNKFFKPLQDCSMSKNVTYPHRIDTRLQQVHGTAMHQLSAVLSRFIHKKGVFCG